MDKTPRQYVLTITCLVAMVVNACMGDDPPVPISNAEKAWKMLNASIGRMVDSGPAFQAKIRQVTRVGGQEVTAVGRYIQSSGRRGLMRMDLRSPIGDQTSRFEQTCDGRLVWTREQVGDGVRIRRVDIGRLDEVSTTTGIPSRFRVGGLPELIDTIAWDYDLRLSRATLRETQRVWVVSGELKPSLIDQMLLDANISELPAEMPIRVRIALTKEEPLSLIPIRIEFFSGSDSDAVNPAISEMDLYEISVIEPPQEEFFRYSTSEEDAHFTNETDLYLDRFRLRLATLPGYSLLRR